jgi:Phage tail assembly chaperone proteins, E, or 41 or 14
MSGTKEKPSPGFDGIDTVWLVKPCEAYGEKMDKLVFREPTAADVQACGNPFMFTTDGDTKVDTKAVFKMAERLAGVPASTIGALSVRDFNEVQAAVCGFFGTPAVPSTSSTESTTSPGDGVVTLDPSSRSPSASSTSSNAKRSA